MKSQNCLSLIWVDAEHSSVKKVAQRQLFDVPVKFLWDFALYQSENGHLLVFLDKRLPAAPFIDVGRCWMHFLR